MKAKSPLDLIRASSKLVREAVLTEVLNSRFLLGSHNGKKLKQSLGAVGRLDLAEKTLLAPDIHKRHAERLDFRLQSKWEKISTKARTDWKKLPKEFRKFSSPPTDHEVAANHFRFLTLIDSVTFVDAEDAVLAGIKLKEKITDVVKSTSGISCLGAIEIEVVSMSMMREVRRLDKTTNSEWRKLDVCEVLASSLKSSLYFEKDSLFLIHFHGLIIAKASHQFDALSQKLKGQKCWTLAPRQVEMKKLSTQFGGKPKSVEKNLLHIATYITKGGNDWMANKAYLRYKIGFENDDESVNDEASWVAKNWRRSKLLQQEHNEEGITDIFSLTVFEVAQLTIAIDRMMGLNRMRTGYLLSVS